MILSISAPYSVRLIRSSVFNGHIDIEKINEPFLYKLKGAPAEYKAGLERAHRQRLARPARERHLREAHRGGRGAVCLTPFLRGGPSFFNEGSELASRTRLYSR